MMSIKEEVAKTKALSSSHLEWGREGSITEGLGRGRGEEKCLEKPRET